MNLLQNNTDNHENVLSESPANRLNIYLFHENTTDDEPVIQRQPTTPQQPSQVTHDTAESVQDTLTNPPNTSITTDSNDIQIPTRNIKQHTDHSFNQEIPNPSTLPVTNTIYTQPPQLHHTIQRTYDPPPQSENSTHSTSHISPQQGSSYIFSIRQNPLHETQFHTSPTPMQSHQTLQYLPAQPFVSSNRSPILTNNTLHTNPITNVTTSRSLSRPPSPLIQNNPLSYNLTNTNHHPQYLPNKIQSTNTNIQPHKQFQLFKQLIPNLKTMLLIYLPHPSILLLLILYLQLLYLCLLKVLQHTLTLLHLFQNLLNL